MWIFLTPFAYSQITTLGPTEEKKTDRTIAMQGFLSEGFLVFGDQNFQNAKNRYWIDGRMMIDAVAVEGHKKNSYSDGIELRRARFGLKFIHNKFWKGEFDIDVSANAIEVKDMWMAYWQEQWELKFGAHKPPFSLEELISSRSTTFLERGLPNELVPKRLLGASYLYYGKNYWLSLGYFGDEVTLGAEDTQDVEYNDDMNYDDDDYKPTRSRMESQTLAARFVLRNDWGKHLIHLGGSHYKKRFPMDGSGGLFGKVMNYDRSPEVHLIQISPLDTDDITHVSNIKATGLELAYQWGSLMFQSEYIKSTVERSDGFLPLNFSGYYASVSWMTKNHQKSYYYDDAEFGQFDVALGGLWEFALRVSHLNLNDKDIMGGEARNMTFGINRYFNNHVRAMVNIILVNLDQNATGPKPQNNKLALVGNEDLTIIATRLQYLF